MREHPCCRIQSAAIMPRAGACQAASHDVMPQNLCCCGVTRNPHIYRCVQVQGQLLRVEASLTEMLLGFGRDGVVVVVVVHCFRRKHLRMCSGMKGKPHHSWCSFKGKTKTATTQYNLSEEISLLVCMWCGDDT